MTMKGGKIIDGEKDIYLQGRSPEFARWMDDTVKKRWPARIKEMQEFYQKAAKRSLEDLLFGRDK